MISFKKLNPKADKKYLIIIAGIMWCGVGIMLNAFAAEWLFAFHRPGVPVYAFAGIVLAMPIHFFGFLKLADKNINRLLPLKEKRCVFSFITWKSYFTIIIMMTLGITLRHSTIPKQDLAIIYIGIGLGLFLSGLRYIKHFFLLRFNDQLTNNQSTNQN